MRRMKTAKCPFKAQEHASDSRQRPYRLWYTIEVQASAPPPERTLEETCAAHFVVAVDMAVTNPTRERIVMVMDALIEGVALSVSPRSFCIQGNKLHIT